MFEGLNVRDWMEIAGFVFMAGGFVYGVRELKSDVTGMKKELEKLNTVVLKQALSEQRIDNIEKANIVQFQDMKEDIRELKKIIDDMQHGRRFINTP